MRLPRWVHKLYAGMFGYFWLPCTLCGREYGGHEWRKGHAIYDESDLNYGHGICDDHDSDYIRLEDGTLQSRDSSLRFASTGERRIQLTRD
jgi:hypothetical protein